MKATLQTNIENGRFARNYDLFLGILKEFEGKEVEVSVSPKKKRRSNKQNAYYWASVLPIVRQLLKDVGINIPQSYLHDELRRRFLLVVEVGDDGIEFERAKSTTELTTVEWEDFMHQVREWAHETFGAYIPQPNEQMTLQG